SERLGAPAAPYALADVKRELRRRARFCHEEIRPRLLCSAAIRGPMESAESNDPDLLRHGVSFEHARSLPAVEAWHRQVHHDDRRAECSRQAHAGVTTASLCDAVPRLLEELPVHPT